MQRDQLSPLAEGYQLKEYLIEKMLAAGGFGITYLAEEGPPLSRKVAVKEYLPPDMAMRGKDGNAVVPIRAEDEEDFAYGLKAFSKMARTLANLDHPNIVTVLRVLRANSTAYMITEYQDRESLGSTLARRESQGLHGIEEVDLQELFSPLLEGIEAVHNAGILHRSIKPSSICLKWDGTPMLLGFGSARHREDASGTRLTATIAAGFSPIELYGRDGAQGPWTDIYGLGAVLYRAIAGERPLDAPQRSEAVKAGRPDPLVPASRIGRNRFSEALLALVDHALAINPEDRPQTIDAWRGDRSAVTPPAPRPEPAPQPGKEKPTTKASTEPPASASPPSRQRPETTEWRERSRRPAMVAVLAVVAALIAGGAGLLAYVDNLEKDRENQQLTAKLQAQEEAKRKSEEARIRAEEAKRKAEEEAKRRAEAEEEATRRAEEEARLRAEAEAQAREEAKLRAEEEEKRKAEDEARQKAEAEAKRRTDEEAKREAAAKAKRDAAKKEAVREEAAKADPKDAALRDAKAGLAAARKSKYDDAIELYTRAISSGGLSQKHLVVAYNNRGNLFLRKEQYDRAIKDFDEAVKLKPDYVKAYINRGNAYSDKRQFERAITNFTKAISLNPDEPTAYFNRCLTFERLGQRDRAIGDCRKALQLNPNDADARTALRQFGVTP